MKRYNTQMSKYKISEERHRALTDPKLARELVLREQGSIKEADQAENKAKNNQLLISLGLLTLPDPPPRPVYIHPAPFEKETSPFKSQRATCKCHACQIQRL